MPRTFNPSPPEAGPGSAFARTSLSKKRSRRRSKATQSAKDKENKPKKSFIGEDLLEWHDENKQAFDENTDVFQTADKTPSDPKEENNENIIAPTLPERSATSRQAIALDTRFIETKSGTEIGELVCQGYEALLRTLVARGATPCLSVSTAPPDDSDKSSKKQSSIVLQSEDAEKLEKLLSEGATLLSKVTYSSNAKDGKRGNAVPIPKALSAKWSWKVMANMVKSIVGDDKKKKKKDASAEYLPLDITVLSNDVSLFSDTNEKSHQSAVDKFWDHIMPFFQDSFVGSIRIVVAQTESVALQAGSKEDGDMECDGDTLMEGDRDVSALKRNHKTAVAKCIHAIQGKIAERAELDYTAELVEPSKGLPVNLSFSIIDNTTVGYQFLSRQWARQAVVAQGLRSRLQLELPETLDGTQCSLSFDMNYQTLPFRVESSHTNDLFADLQHLTKSKTEVVQMVPLSSIDASLLFGVPITLTAGLEDDFEQYQMMEVLVRSLFRLLQERELAILLRSTTKNIAGQSLFHSSEQAYLLMAQEFPPSVDQHPHSGILFPYAQANQLLMEASAAKTAPILDEDTENQLVEYVDRALDCLECNPINPLYMEGSLSALTSNGSSSAMQPMTLDSLRDENKHHGSHAQFSDDEWNDTTGVGSRRHLPNQEDDAAVKANGEEDTEFQDS